MDQKNKYYEKYKKYCEKEKKLVGGVIPTTRHESSDFMAGWNQIKNIGKMNCGIFINPHLSSLIMKCEYKNLEHAKNMYNRANAINEQAKISSLSKIYADIKTMHEYHNESKNYLYVIMEKMDGTIMDLISEVIPKLCVNFVGHRYTKRQRVKLLKIFNFKLNSLEYSQKNIDIYHTEKGNIFYKINILRKILEEKILRTTYEDFLKKIINLLNIVYPIILKKIDKLVMDIYKLNYIQYDNHMGNMGYKIRLDAGKKLLEQNIYDPNIWKNNLEILFIDPAPHTFLEIFPGSHKTIEEAQNENMMTLLNDINNLSPSDYRCDILYFIKQNKIFTSKNKHEESHITNILYDIFGDSAFFLQKNYDFILVSEEKHESLESYFSDEKPKYKLIMV
jgi:hypothetical protein